MRSLAILILTALLTIPVFAQEETLVGGNIEHGGFGGPSVKLTRLNGADAVLVGGIGGWIINHTFVIGGGGYGLVTDIQARTPGPAGERNIDMGYGGLYLEYIGASDKLLHWTADLLIGAGGVAYRNQDSLDGLKRSMQSFFVLEPGVNVNLNVTSFFRIGAGVSYRYIAGLTSTASSNADLRGVNGNLILKFGKF